MYPDQPTPPSSPAPDPYPTSPFFNGGPGQSPQVSGPVTSPAEPPAPRSKFLLLLAGGAALELLIIVALIVVLASHTKSPSQAPAGGAANQSQGLDTANPTNIQLLNDSISQDISTLNDEQDFPANNLDDKTLGL